MLNLRNILQLVIHSLQKTNHPIKKAITLCMLWALTLVALAQPHAGSMTNPVIFADVPDLDIIRVGKTYCAGKPPG